jgi:predicted alpha/beta-hydrolase family hydrolase
MLAAAEPGLADGLLLLSYPLHPPQRPTDLRRPALRTTHFPNLQTPAMFVHGTRDGFATLDELTAALALIPARTELLSIPSAGHELLTKQNRDDLPRRIVAAFQSFAHASPL